MYIINKIIRFISIILKTDIRKKEKKDCHTFLTMSFTQKLSLLLSVLPELSREHEEHNMISITVSGRETITPELFQVIDMYDGTFKVQHLAVNTHEKLLDETIPLEELSAVVNKIATGLEMCLLWGPHNIVVYNF
jgi:hypothetical protein